MLRRVLLIAMAAFLMAACISKDALELPLKLASKSDLPEEIVAAPTSVQEAYRFAIANPELLKQIPCYCGCGGVGHTSNYDCYISEVKADGEIAFDMHAFN